MYEVDFLPVESEGEPGSKSGDAIAIRFTVHGTKKEAVIVIDGGFTSVGEDLVGHIEEYYETDDVDLVISSHPDADHLNGLSTVISRLRVAELLIHQPRLHVRNVSDFSNLEAVDELIAVAKKRGTKIAEPFTGLTRFNGQLQILGPTEGYYEKLILQHLQEEKAYKGQLVKAARKVPRILQETGTMPPETLGDDGETSPRNNSSVITLLKHKSRRLLFTGDAGIDALTAAAEEYERSVGSFGEMPLRFFQAPHHGSRRNLGPTILDRILGKSKAPHSSGVSAFISSAKISEKHPSPKVVNALTRRGCSVVATNGRSIRHSHKAPARDGWSTLSPFGPLSEENGDD